MVSTLLFPSSFYDLRRVDEDMQQEYDAVLKTGLFRVILFSYDDWFNHGVLKLSEVPQSETDVVYRGWMMLPEQYQSFYTELLKKNICPVTDPEMYSHLHIFPNVYRELSGDTARILTFPLHAEIDIEKVKQVFPRFMVKDYVKSVKGTEFPVYFTQNTTQAEFDHWMEVFYDYRGTLLTGGICIKEYLDLKKYDGKTNEFRVYYIANRIASVCRNSLQDFYTPEPPAALIGKYRDLGSVFYTIDYAELEDGSWKIIETGDGSVSGLSDKQDHEAFYRALYRCLN
ncbi:MAG: ATP-grasp domain-containing protein [Anaerolineaceae bacterium]|nr:ATP-grasp domain-containing protein [Anaerolineaceae bacterium]